jgi:hypothetical protein
MLPSFCSQTHKSKISLKGGFALEFVTQGLLAICFANGEVSLYNEVAQSRINSDK